MSAENDSKEKIPGQTENDELREILGIRAEDVSTISKFRSLRTIRDGAMSMGNIIPDVYDREDGPIHKSCVYRRTYAYR